MDKILNELCINNCNLIKVDVEGSEYEVLKGLIKTLKNSRECRVIVEILNKNKEKCLKLMDKLGYVGCEVKHNKGTHGEYSYFVF